jgi:hypothetical protein
MHRLRSLLACLLLATALATACGSGDTDAPQSTSQGPKQLFPNWPPLLNDLRFHWTAEPGIDVTTGPAVAVRAYVESYDVATLTLDPKNVYPGFLRATPENQEQEGEYFQLMRIRPLVGFTMGPEDARMHHGFVTYHILQLGAKGNGFEAIVCKGDYSHFLSSTEGPGNVYSAAVDKKTGKPSASGGIYVQRIEFTQNDPRVGPNPPSPVTGPQRGPAPAPYHDVFGNWFITAASRSGWGPVKDLQSISFPPPELRRRCAERMPHSEAERLTMMLRDEPPPHGQPEPGWPVKTN